MKNYRIISLVVLLNLIFTANTFAFDWVVSNASSTSSTVEAGSELTVTFDIEYQMTYSGSSHSNYRCYLSTDPVLDIGQDIQLSLKYATFVANEVVNISRTLLIPFGISTGTYYILINKSVSSGETNTNNNLDFVQISIISPSISTKYAQSAIYDVTNNRYLISKGGYSNIIERDTLGNLDYFRTGGTDKYGDMCIAGNKLCVIANDTSIMEFDLDNGDLLRIYNSSTTYSLKGIVYDNTNGYIYTTSRDGISVINYSSFTYINTYPPSYIEGRPYWDSLENRLLFGIGTDIYKFNPSTFDTEYINEAAFNSQHIECITKDKRGNYFLGQTSGVLFYGDGFNPSTITDTIMYPFNTIKYNPVDDVLILSRSSRDILLIPLSVPLLYPANNTAISTNSINLIWKERGYLHSELNDTIKYQYEVSLTNDFSNIIASGITANDSMFISNLVDFNTYYWRVKSIVNSLDYESIWSDTFSFNIDISTSINSTINNQSIRIYPNPTNGLITMENSNNSRWEYSLINSLGQEIHVGEINNQQETIDLNRFKKGIYVMKFSDTNKQYSVQLILR